MIKSRGLRWAGYVARMEESRNAFITFIPTGKRPLGRSRLKDIIRMDVENIVISTRNCVDSVQDKKVGILSRF